MHKKIIIVLVIILIVAIISAIVLFKVNTKKELSDEEILRLAKVSIEKYEQLEVYQASNIGAMPYILDELNLDTRENIDKILNKDGNYNIDAYVKTNTKYEDFKQEMLKYVTQKVFTEKYNNYINMDGYVGIQAVGAGFAPTSVQKIELISKNRNEYKFKVTIRDEEVFDHYLNGEDITGIDYLFEYTVTCKYNNGYMQIDEKE